MSCYKQFVLVLVEILKLFVILSKSNREAPVCAEISKTKLRLCYAMFEN